MHTRLKQLTLTFTALALLGSCGQANHEKASTPAAASAPAAAAAAPSLPTDAASATASAAKPATENSDVTSSSKADQISSAASPTAAVDSNRKFIRNADARFAVKDVYQSAIAIEDAVNASGGFITVNNIAADKLRNERYAKGDGNIIDITEYQVNGALTVRVPSNKTQEFLRSIANQIEFLDMRNYSARDAQFDILRQKVATATATNKFERGDSKVSELEYADEVAFATIQLGIYQPNKVRQSEYADINAAIMNNRPEFFKRLGQSLATGWYYVLEILLALANIWPVWLGIGLIIWLRKRVKFNRPQWLNAKKEPLKNQED